MFEVVSTLSFVAACMSGIACGLVSLINLFRFAANRKPGAPLFPKWYSGPFSYVYRPADLTARGLAARRLYFYGLGGFVVCFLAALIIGTSTGVAH